MKKKILILLISIFLIIPIFSFVNIVNSETEPVYYSDLFYGYDSDYLSSDYLTRYHNNSSYINTKVFNDYVNDPNFYWIKLRSAFSITADTSKLVQLISDGYAGTSFTYNNLLDSVSIDFAKEMMNSALLHQADETIGTVNSMLGKINLLSSQIQKIDNIEIATETEKVTGIYQVVIDNHVFEYLSVEQIRNVLFEIPINKANTKAIADFFSAGKSTMDLCNALSTALVIEDFREGIINEIIDNTPKGTALHEGMTRLRNQIKNGWWTFFVNNYLTKTVLDKCLGVAKEALSLSPMTVKIVQGIISVVDLVVFDMIFNIPTVEDILRQQILTTYSDQLYNILLKKKVLFSTDQFISDDIFVYENIFNAYVTASKLALQQSKSIAPSQEDKNYINSMYNISYAEYIGLIKQQIENITPSSRKTKFFNNYVVNGAVNYKGPSDVIESNTIYTFNGAFNGNMAISKYSSINTTDKNINIKGRLTINNEFSVNSHNLEVDSLEINEYMLMDDPNSYVLINGDLIIHNCKNRTYSANFNEGTIEVKGNLIDDGGNESIFSTSNYFNFIFSRDIKQTVQTSSNLGNIKVNSPGLITNFIKASSLKSDVNIYGDNTYIEIKNSNKHTIYHKGDSVQLSGNIYNLETTGDVLINDWFLVNVERELIADGNLTVNGELNIGKSSNKSNPVEVTNSDVSVNVDSCMLIDGDLKVNKNGILNIGSAYVEINSLDTLGKTIVDDVNAYVLVNGDARICESYSDEYSESFVDYDTINYSSFTKGTMEIKGNLTNVPLSEDTYDYHRWYGNIKRTGYFESGPDFDIIFSGNQAQTVEIVRSNSSSMRTKEFRFGDVKIPNPNVTFNNTLIANSIDNDVHIEGDNCLVILTDFDLESDNTIYHDGEFICLEGTFYGIESSGSVQIGQARPTIYYDSTDIIHHANIAKDLIVQKELNLVPWLLPSGSLTNVSVGGKTKVLRYANLEMSFVDLETDYLEVEKEGEMFVAGKDSYILVNKDVKLPMAWNGAGCLVNFYEGTLEVKGNFKTDCDSVNGRGIDYRFYDDFNVIFSGDSIQTLDLSGQMSYDGLKFRKLKATGKGLKVLPSLHIDTLESDLNLYGSSNIKINNYCGYSVNIYDIDKKDSTSLDIPNDYSISIVNDGNNYKAEIKKDDSITYSVNCYLGDELVKIDSSYSKNSLIFKPKLFFPNSSYALISDWYLEKELINKWNFDSDVIDKDISLYADLTVWPTSVKCSDSYHLLEEIGSTYKLKPKIYPSYSTETDLTYTVDKDNIISVDETGLVTALDYGQATVTIKTKNGKSFEYTIGVAEHNYYSLVYKPTCTEQGFTAHLCSRRGCTEMYIDNYRDAFGHDMIKANVTDVTYNDLPISEYYYCARCTKYFLDSEGNNELNIKDIILDDDLHDDGKITREPTCHHYGIKTYTGLNRGYQLFSRIDKLDHNLERIEKVFPNCENPGHILYYHCLDCDALFTDEECTDEINLIDTVIEPLGHDISSDSQIESSTYTSGYKNGLICERCKKVFSQADVVPATGFSMDYSFVNDLKNEMVNNLEDYLSEEELSSVPLEKIIDSSLIVKTKEAFTSQLTEEDYEYKAIEAIYNNLHHSICGYFSIYPSLQLLDEENNAYIFDLDFVKLSEEYQIRIKPPIEILNSEEDGIVTRRRFYINTAYINDGGEIVSKEIPAYIDGDDICFDTGYLTTFAICYSDSREPDDLLIRSKEDGLVISTKSETFLKMMYETNDRSVKEGTYLYISSDSSRPYLLGNYIDEINNQTVEHNDFELDDLEHPTQLYVKSDVFKKWSINNGIYDYAIIVPSYNPNFKEIEIKCGVPLYPEDLLVTSNNEGIIIESKDDDYIRGMTSITDYDKGIFGASIVLDNNNPNDLKIYSFNNFVYKDISSGNDITINNLEYYNNDLISKVFIPKDNIKSNSVADGNYTLKISDVPGYCGTYTTNIEVKCGTKKYPDDLIIENINGDIVITSKDSDFINSFSAFTNYDSGKRGGSIEIIDNDIFKVFTNSQYIIDGIEYKDTNLICSSNGDSYMITLKSDRIAESGIVNGEYDCVIYLYDYGAISKKINITKGAKLAPEIKLYEDDELEALVIKSEKEYLKDLCRVTNVNSPIVESYILFNDCGFIINNSCIDDNNNILIEYDELNNIAFIKYETLNRLGFTNGYEDITIHSYQWQEKLLEYEIKGLDSNINKLFNIYYFVDDGVNNLNNPLSYDGTEKIELLNPTRENSVFCGWYTDESCLTKKESIEIGETGDITLYALFRTNQYNVVFHDDDLSYTQGGLTSGANNKLTTLGEIGFNKNGYQFFAWIDEYGNQYLDGSTIYSLCDDNESVDLYAIWTQNSDNDTSIVGATVTTNGTMDVNYYVELNDTGIKNYLNDYQMKVSYGTKESIISPSINSIKYIDDEDGKKIPTFSFSFSLAPKDITQTMRVQLQKKDIRGRFINQNESITYSIQTYYENMLESGSAVMKDVAAAALNYSAYAQQYFGININNLANKNIDDYGYSGIYTDLSNFEIPNSELYHKEKIIGIKGFSFIGNSIILKSDIRIRFYYNYSGNINDLTFECNSKDFVVGKSSQGNYIEIQNITALDIDNIYTLNVYDKKGNSAKMTYSVYNYIISKCNDSDKKLSDLVKSIYLYNKAAEAKVK